MTLGNVMEITQSFRVDIENADASANPESNLAGIGAYHPCSKYDHFRRGNA